MAQAFAGAFLGVTALTAEARPDWIAWLRDQSFFRYIVHRAGLAVGDQFRELYARAASACAPHTPLHLCFLDRLAFIFQSEHCEPFIEDMRAVQEEELPMLFHRSAAAWASYPANYRTTEQMVTTAGELLLGKTLDFAWCHLAVRSDTLSEITPRTERPGLSMMAEIIVQAASLHPIRTREVDWLAWEDPFIAGSDPRQLKREREGSLRETRKRLAYVIPMLQVLDAAAARSVGPT